MYFVSTLVLSTSEEKKFQDFFNLFIVMIYAEAEIFSRLFFHQLNSTPEKKMEK